MTSEPVLRVKNWREFQHYTNRRPPWIKFHVTLLDDYEFQCLPLASRALAPMLWLLASQNVEGTIPANPALLAFRLRWEVKDIKAGLTPLIDKGFLVGASNLLAECLQSATSETETETETEGAKAPTARGSKRCPEDFIPDRTHALKEIPDLDYERESQKFKDWEFKTARKDWSACWRTWIGNARDRKQYARIASSGLPKVYGGSV